MSTMSISWQVPRRERVMTQACPPVERISWFILVELEAEIPFFQDGVFLHQHRQRHPHAAHPLVTI